MSYASLMAIIEQNKETYYLAPRRTQTTLQQEMPDWESWLHFFVRCLHRKSIRLQERVTADRNRRATHSPLAARLAALFQTNDTVTLAEAAKVPISVRTPSKESSRNSSARA